MCKRCQPAFPVTAEAEQEQISLHNDQHEEIHFRRAGLKIEIELAGKTILVTPAALLCAARVLAGEENKN